MPAGEFLRAALWWHHLGVPPEEPSSHREGSVADLATPPLLRFAKPRRSPGGPRQPSLWERMQWVVNRSEREK
jgi:hypothetical protein